jgi:hypothetical protein
VADPYATSEQVLAIFETPITSAAKIARLDSAAITASEELDKELGGRDYRRHPALEADDATSEFYADGDGSGILCVHQGIPAAPVKLEVSWDLGQSWAEVASAGWWLAGSDPYSSEPIPDGEPWFHVRMHPWAGAPVFPRGTRTVRITGAYGWPAVPATLVEACAQRARQTAFGDAAYEGSIPSDPAFGPQSASGRWPHAFYRFLERERSRFFCSR